MARPREFDETQVLHRALELFWAQGYEATSVDDLCRATGLSRSSLYHSFGSKRAVLDATIAVYEDGSARRIAALLDEVRPIQDGLRAFFMGFVDDAVDGNGRRGCFIGNCTGELAGRDPAAADPEAWRDEVRFWKQAGVSHVTLNNTFGRMHHERIPERSVEAHTTAMRRYQEAVSDLL